MCYVNDGRSIWFWICFSCASFLPLVVWCVCVGFPYFTNVVQLLCSLSGWLHLSCYSIGTGFNGAETSCRIEHILGILLMNSNYFAIFFSGVLVMSVQISIIKSSSYCFRIKFQKSSSIPVSTSYNLLIFILQSFLILFFRGKAARVHVHWSGSTHNGSDCRKGVCLPRSIMKCKRFW